MTDLVEQSAEHDCGFDGDWRQCIDGRVYGPCEDENCGGVCEIERDCPCDCHKEADRG
jgi:hypothetical protein